MKKKCKHLFGKWSEPKELKIISDYGNGNPLIKRVQYRKCTLCEIEEVNEIDWWYPNER